MPPLGLLVFVVGAGSLGAEIAAVRLLAPYFGASTIVWANTIGVVLVALAAGYWLGGRLADRNPTLRGLCRLALAAAGLLALVPFAAGPLLDAGVKALDSISAGAFAGSLLAVLVLVAVPVMLLGAVSPWALRLAVRDVEAAGTVAGRLYAISTAGSLLGTLLAALVLVPLLGTRNSFLVLALAIALVSLPGVWAARRRFALVPTAIALLLAVPDDTLRANPDGRVIHETETAYQYAQVLERPDGSRRLELNEGQAIHSLYRPGTVLTGGYWDEFLVLPFATRDSPPRRIAILGSAAGTTARAYGVLFPRTHVDAVEIDGRLTEIGRRWFGLGGPRLHTHTADARPFLRRTEQRYDSIFVDAYRQPYIPFYLTTREFFELTRERLRPGGTVIVNVGQPKGQHRLEQVLAATMRESFASVARDQSEPTNTLLVASERRVSQARLERNATALPAKLEAIARGAAGRLEPGMRGGEVYTDDHAPVEWLVDGSLLDYASGG